MAFVSDCSYVGEVGLWVGIWALCTTSLSAHYVPRYTWLFAGASPLMTYFLLRKVSGVPPLEVSEYSICRCSFCALRGLLCGHSGSQMTRHGALVAPVYGTADSQSAVV